MMGMVGGVVPDLEFRGVKRCCYLMGLIQLAVLCTIPLYAADGSDIRLRKLTDFFPHGIFQRGVGGSHCSPQYRC